MDVTDLKGLFVEVNKRMDAALQHLQHEFAGVRSGRASVTILDGVYSADPMIDKTALRYDRISYHEVLDRRLKVMDTTAVSLCMDNKLPIIVFNLRKSGNLRRVVMGEPVGTLVSETPTAGTT